MFEKQELDNSANVKYEHALCNQHSFNALVYVRDYYTRLGLVISLIDEGFYWESNRVKNILTGSRDYSIDSLSKTLQLNDVIYVINGVIYFGRGSMFKSKKLDPKCSSALPHDEWLKSVSDQFNKCCASIEDIDLYLENPEKFKKSNLGQKPVINCGTDVKMFENVVLLRNDDNIYDSDQRKKLGIYQYERLFIDTLTESNFTRFCNMQDFDPEKNKAFRLATIKDILNNFELGKIAL